MAEAGSPNIFWAWTFMEPVRRINSTQDAKRGTSDEVIMRKITQESGRTRESGIEFVDDYTTLVCVIYSFGDHFPTSVAEVRSAAAAPPGQSVENQPMARHASRTDAGSTE